MKLIIGLGNTGEKYQNTRHNVGFLVLDSLVKELGVTGYELSKKHQSLVTSYQSKVVLVKPQTFMNSSGVAVKKLVNQYKINMSDLWVIHDDLDLRLGEYKIQFGVGPKLHNGISSIEEKLDQKDFWRVRIGVDNRDKDNRIPGDEYVLRNFQDDEMELVEGTIKRIVDDLIKRIVD